MNPNSELSTARRHRLWMLYGILGLCVILSGAIQAQPELERNFKGWMISMVFLLGLALSLIWFLLFSRFRWKVRVGGLAVILVAGWGLKQLLRVDGTADGTGLPRVVWRWSQRPHASPPKLENVANAPTVASLDGVKDSPQLLGPDRNGLLTGTLLGTNWVRTPPKLLWRQPVGAGWSSFSVVGTKAYTQEQQGMEEWVSCLDLASGRRLWTATNSARFQEWQGGEGPRSTPTVHQGLVYALGATGTLDCLDAETGRRLWRREVLREHKLSNLIWGVSASPLVWEDLVVVTGGADARDTVIAYQRMTGEPVWSVGRDKTSYASPMAAQLCGDPVILSVNAASLTVHEARTGKVLLDYDWPTDKWPKAAQPVVVGTNRVFLSAGYGVGCVFLELGKDASGKWKAEELWKNKSMKTQFNTPALRDGFLYGLDDGLLACVELSSGKRRWKDGRFGSGQSLLVEDLVLIQSEPGAVVLAKAVPEGYTELGRLEALSSKTWNYPTVAGRYLLVRNDQEAACYQLPLR